MSMRAPSICRFCRAAGEKLFLKGDRCLGAKCALTRRPFPAGQHGEKRRRKLSDYGHQLQEKQKARRLYNLSERQMRRFYGLAIKSRGNTGERLLQLLESKLDNIVYRAGLAASRRAAAQLITHGAVTINGRKTKTPSALVKARDKIKVSTAPQEESITKKAETPEWMKVDLKAQEVTLDALPGRDALPTTLEEQLIIEYYSRLL